MGAKFRCCIHRKMAETGGPVRPSRWRDRLAECRPPKPRAPRRSAGCEKHRAHFGEYLEGWLAPRKTCAIERHLRTCIACRSLLDRARRKREAFNLLLRDVLRGDALAPQLLKNELQACLRCVTAPGSVRCPRLRTHLRLVAEPAPT